VIFSFLQKTKKILHGNFHSMRKNFNFFDFFNYFNFFFNVTSVKSFFLNKKKNIFIYLFIILFYKNGTIPNF